MILLVSFAGEVLKLALPFPVPGSIYGMLLLFIALCTGVIRLEHVRETGLFLVEIMPILFVSAGVGLMDSWGDLRKILLPVDHASHNCDRHGRIRICNAIYYASQNKEKAA